MALACSSEPKPDLDGLLETADKYWVASSYQADCENFIPVANEIIKHHRPREFSDHRIIYQRKFLCHQRLGQIEMAIELASESIKRFHGSDRWWVQERGDIYMRQGEFELALKDYDAGVDDFIADNGAKGEWLIRRGFAYKSLNEMGKAKFDFAEACRIRTLFGFVHIVFKNINPCDLDAMKNSPPPEWLR